MAIKSTLETLAGLLTTQILGDYEDWNKESDPQRWYYTNLWDVENLRTTHSVENIRDSYFAFCSTAFLQINCTYDVVESLVYENLQRANLLKLEKYAQIVEKEFSVFYLDMKDVMIPFIKVFTNRANELSFAGQIGDHTYPLFDCVFSEDVIVSTSDYNWRIPLCATAYNNGIFVPVKYCGVDYAMAITVALSQFAEKSGFQIGMHGGDGINDVVKEVCRVINVLELD